MSLEETIWNYFYQLLKENLLLTVFVVWTFSYFIKPELSWVHQLVKLIQYCLRKKKISPNIELIDSQKPEEYHYDGSHCKYYNVELNIKNSPFDNVASFCKARIIFKIKDQPEDVRYPLAWDTPQVPNLEEYNLKKVILNDYMFFYLIILEEIKNLVCVYQQIFHHGGIFHPNYLVVIMNI